MTGRNWNRASRDDRARRHGTEERDQGTNLPPVAGVRRAPAMSKEELRREADRLLAGYTGTVQRLPELQGNPAIGRKVTRNQRVASQLSGDVPQMRAGPRVTKAPFRKRKSLANSSHIPEPLGYGHRAVPAGLVIYADGCCEPNPGPGGWGFVVYRDGVEYHAESGGDLETTNQRMELTAAIEAMKWVARHVFDAADAPRLFSDSMYTVNGANDWRHGWKRNGWRRGGSNAKPKNTAIANLDLWQQLDRLLVGAPLTLEWCRGHSGIIGNERADELSLIGRESVLEQQPDPLSLIRQQLDQGAF